MYASQTSVAPPTFVLFTNSEAKLHFSYERFLENRLRESYGFFGNPIRIQVRGRKECAQGRGAQDRRRARAGSAQAGEERPGLEADASRSRAPARAAASKRAQREAAPHGAEERGGLMRLERLYCPTMAAPKRELFKAADVCEVVQVQPYVLRSWEAEFPQIGQAAGRRRTAPVSPIGRRAGAADQAAGLRRRPDAVRRAAAARRRQRREQRRGRCSSRKWSATACASSCGR